MKSKKLKDFAVGVALASVAILLRATTVRSI